jgi:hypothetical protein
MRKLAGIVNMLLVALWFVGLIMMIAAKTDGVSIFLFVFLVFIPIINFLALAESGKEQDLLSLYFERKKLEQQKKLDELKKSMGREI